MFKINKSQLCTYDADTYPNLRCSRAVGDTYITNVEKSNAAFHIQLIATTEEIISEINGIAYDQPDFNNYVIINTDNYYLINGNFGLLRGKKTVLQFQKCDGLVRVTNKLLPNQALRYDLIGLHKKKFIGLNVYGYCADRNGSAKEFEPILELDGEDFTLDKKKQFLLGNFDGQIVLLSRTILFTTNYIWSENQPTYLYKIERVITDSILKIEDFLFNQSQDFFVIKDGKFINNKDYAPQQFNKLEAFDALYSDSKSMKK